MHITDESLTAEVNPWDFDHPMVCQYSYDEGEPMIWSPIDLAHPGSPPTVSLISCRVNGVEIYDMLSPSQVDRIEDEILTKYHEG